MLIVLTDLSFRFYRLYLNRVAQKKRNFPFFFFPLLLIFSLFFLRAHAIEDKLRKDQSRLVEEYVTESAVSLMKKENIVRGK